MLTGTLPNERKNHVFYRDVLLLRIFLQSWIKKRINAKRSDGEIWKKKTLLEEKNLFSLLWAGCVFKQLHNRQVWSRPGIPPFPPPTLPKAEVLPLKLQIVWKVWNIELWPIPCVMKYWRLDLSFKNKKESSLHAAFYGKNHSVQCPPPPLYQSLKSYQSFHDPQSELRQRFY